MKLFFLDTILVGDKFVKKKMDSILYSVEHIDEIGALEGIP
jgi:hypothetical protein